MSIAGPPHIEPPRWPGQTSHSGGSVISLSRSEWKIPRAPSAFSIARSGRATSLTNSVSPVSTAHGRSLRAVSMSANAVCSGRWPGRVQRPHAQRAELELPAVVERLVLVVGLGEAVDVDRRAGGRREPAVAGDVVGVVVGLEHVLDAHAHVASELEVLVDLEARVDDGGDPGVVVPDQVRRAAEVVVGDLAEDHAPTLSERQHRH